MATASPLRQRMIEDMTTRNLSPAKQQSYMHTAAKFSRSLPTPLILPTLGGVGGPMPQFSDGASVVSVIPLWHEQRRERLRAFILRVPDERQVKSRLDRF